MNTVQLANLESDLVGTVQILGVVLPIYATVISLRSFRGTALPLWILLSWFLPFIGPIITIIAARKQGDIDA